MATTKITKTITNENNETTKEETKLTTRKTTRKTNGKAKKTLTASLAAMMLATTAASIGASAMPLNPYGKYINDLVNSRETKIAQLIYNQNKNKSYKEVLDTWQKTLKDPTGAFPTGCDIDGDGEVTEEEKSEITDKMKEYAAGVTVGLMKKGLNACCDGLADCFEAPMGDLANAIFDVPQDASNDDVINKIDESTKQVLDKISESENRIVNRVTNLNVASEYGKIIDLYASAANTHRDTIKAAMDEKTPAERTVELAASLGDLGSWSEKNIVNKRSAAREVLTSPYCMTDPENHYNLYNMAFKVALDKGSLFMKEAVENSQSYVVNCTNKYLKSSITLLEMLVAMEDVTKITPEQVSKFSGGVLENYNKIKNNAGKAAAYKALVLDDLLGSDGILTRSANYVNRKVTEPTTYVANGVEQSKHIKLKKDLDAALDLSFITPYRERTFVRGSDWKWIKDSDKTRMNDSGLTYSEVEGICKHALKTGHTVENYLKANGFDINDPWNNSKRILVTGHYDEHHGTSFMGYTSYEGFNGFDITKKYSKDAGSEKWKLIKKYQEGAYVPYCDEFRVDNGYTYMFFVKE